MTDINLTQDEADALIRLEKHCSDDELRKFPDWGGSLVIPLVSADAREKFLLDIYRGKIDLCKVTYQNRARQVVVLVRLDLGGRPHQNPDGEEITVPHIHIYREGYGDKWAQELDPEVFPDTDDLWEALQAFMRYCNITRPPCIERSLFT